MKFKEKKELTPEQLTALRAWQQQQAMTNNGCVGPVLAAIVIMVMMLLSSCRTVYRMVEVETVRTDTTYVAKVQHDSVWQHDSIYLHEYVRGDTVFVDRVFTQWKYKERLRVDTLYRFSIDSVAYEVEVPRELTSWQKTCMTTGKVSMVLLLMGGMVLMMVLAILLPIINLNDLVTL